MITQFSVDRSLLMVWMDAINKSFVFGGQLHDIFKCIVFELDSKDGLQIKAADGISFVHIKSIPFEVEAPWANFSFAIYADTIYKILSASRKEKVKFSWDDENSQIVIKTEGRYKISAIDSGLFPTRVDVVCELQPFDDLSFVAVIDKMTPFAAKELDRPELAGVSVSDNLYVSTVGTHGVVHPRVENIFGRMTVGVPAIKFLEGLDSSKLGSIRFGKSDRVFVLESESFVYTCAVAEGEFPWSALDTIMNLRNDFAFKVLVSSVNFQAALRRVLLLDTNKFIQLGMQFNEYSIRLFCDSQISSSTSSEEVDVEELRLPDGAEFRSLELRLGVVSVEAFRRLFDGKENMPIMLTVVNERSPVFVQQRNSKYMFYTQVMRPL